jgi:hypothetical protein
MGTVAPTTPPAVAPVVLPLPESTPHSRGSAARAQTLVDERYPHIIEISALADNLVIGLEILKIYRTLRMT